MFQPYDVHVDSVGQLAVWPSIGQNDRSLRQTKAQEKLGKGFAKSDAECGSTSNAIVNTCRLRKLTGIASQNSISYRIFKEGPSG